MSELRRGVSARALVRALLGDGFQLARSKGSPRVFRHHDGRRVVVSHHHLSETFPVGTLRAMLEDACWDEEDLRRLGRLKG